MLPLIITLVVVGLIALFVMGVYNSLVKLRNRVDEAWSDIDVQLKRRYNLIPNIVETVKGYATHEESVLTKVTEARSNAINANGIQEQGQAENMLSGALKSLFAVAESYPQLKANENFLQLQNELVDTEDKIQASRRFYNGMVRDFNTKLQVFPNNLIVGMFSFKARDFFEIEDEEQRENVKVSFNEPKTPVAPAAPEKVSQPVAEAAPSVPLEKPEAAAPEVKVEAPAEPAVKVEVKAEEAPSQPTESPTPTPVSESPAQAPATPAAPAEESKEETKS